MSDDEVAAILRDHFGRHTPGTAASSAIYNLIKDLRAADVFSDAEQWRRLRRQHAAETPDQLAARRAAKSRHPAGTKLPPDNA